MTGRSPEDLTSRGTQSETGVSVSNFAARKVITVTYNDDTDLDGHITYTPQGRTVRAGATMMGWSYSTDSGNSWRYGGTVTPPRGWPVLWGDPAITTDFADQRHVFISNLAVPASKMPADGIQGSLIPYLGGACIAHSENGGVSFKIQQCVTRDFHFYDGGSMATAGRANDRRVFASFVDATAHQIDVWASPNDTGTFALLPNPFPGMTMVSHPRLRFDRTTRSLYVGALAANGFVYLNRFSGGSWGRPVLASLETIGNPDLRLGDRILRVGYQFSFDVGAPSENGGDEVRVLYTAGVKGTDRLYIRGLFCDAELTRCRDAPEWGTTPGNLSITGNQISPNVRAFPGFIGLPPVWKATYVSYGGDEPPGHVSIREGNLAVLPNGTRSFVPLKLVKPLLVCSDLRGYWGDYDELQLAGFEQGSNVAQFILPHSDSSKGCDRRWDYTSSELHVSAVIFK